MEKRSNLKFIIVGLMVITILLLSIFASNSDVETNFITNNNKDNSYKTLEIDNSKLNILFFDVGQGDATFITIDGYNMLIDAGTKSDGDYIMKFLKQQNINKIDFLVGTHVDKDHVEGIIKIIEQFNINNFYMPQTVENNKLYDTILKTVEQKQDLKIEEKEKGYIFNIGSAKCEILSDKDKIAKDDNETSIVLELTYKNTKYLFMGDATRKIEETIKFEKVDVLKVGHHGSKTSTSQNFIDITSPKYSIISVGRNNYGHPDKNVVKRLEEKGKVYETQKYGTIWMKSNGYEIEIELLNNINSDISKNLDISCSHNFLNLLNLKKYDKNRHLAVLHMHDYQ